MRNVKYKEVRERQIVFGSMHVEGHRNTYKERRSESTSIVRVIYNVSRLLPFSRERESLIPEVARQL